MGPPRAALRYGGGPYGGTGFPSSRLFRGRGGGLGRRDLGYDRQVSAPPQLPALSLWQGLCRGGCPEALPWLCPVVPGVGLHSPAAKFPLHASILPPPPFPPAVHCREHQHRRGQLHGLPRQHLCLRSCGHYLRPMVRAHGPPGAAHPAIISHVLQKNRTLYAIEVLSLMHTWHVPSPLQSRWAAGCSLRVVHLHALPSR